jgi:cell division protein FtsN
MLSQAAYSNTNPIPVDRKLPNGIVYKIQIGAFTKPIPQTSFKGLTPITGETRQNSKYVRYFVGLFDTYEAADIVLPHIQRNGYRDAFIVAYRNGQRIGVYIAKREDSQAPDYNTVAQIEKQAVLKIINENAEQTLGKGATLVDLEPLNPSVNLTEVKTTMYTVQIGVYKRHVAHERLYNLSPLYNDLTKSGLIRYTVGQFVDYNQAIQKRNEIRQKGIRDAFVTAYRNGERISITTARKALANVSANTQTEIEPAIVKETTEPEVAPTKTPVTSTPTYNTDQLHYCVQIGAYSNSVPVSIVSSFVQLSKLDELDNFKTDNGQTVYTIGNFKSLSRANLLKQDLVEQGITDAFIIAFDGKNKVAISEAQKVLKP